MIDLIDVGFVGQAAGARRITALGNNPDVDTATLPEDVWTGGGVYPYPASAVSLEIVSASADDTANGAGARTVSIIGLDHLYSEIAQTVALNGTTPVALPRQMLRVNSVVVMSTGSSGVNAGDLTLRDAGAGTTRSGITAGYSISRNAIYTVPAGHTLQITSMVFCINRPTSASDATFATTIRTPTGVVRMPLELSVAANPYRHDGEPGITIGEKNDFSLRCVYASQNNLNVTAGFLALLKKNS